MIKLKCNKYGSVPCGCAVNYCATDRERAAAQFVVPPLPTRYPYEPVRQVQSPSSAICSRFANREYAAYMPSAAEVDERAMFEAWYGEYYTDYMPRMTGGEFKGQYANEATQAMWDAWSARAALAAKQKGI